MSVLNLADNIKVGSLQVQSIYSGSTLVWPTGLWVFETPSPGTTITDLTVSFTGGTTYVNWGDGTILPLDSGGNIDYTY
jgi:hypothetical protein|tara:strand:- start:981 stop:1217 length:237 start_codon:yes stop_codon:yes gene_type:complete